MDRVFYSFRDFNQAIGDIQKNWKPAVMAGMRAAATVVRKEAQDEIGQYQSAAGPFPAWAQLAPSTVRDRVRQGYPPDRPLERTGELRDSYEVDSFADSVGVGSELDRALYLEVGDPRHNLPARSVLGRAFVVSEPRSFAALTRVVYERLKRYL